MTYLYGASVQGIQGYIFATNKLREMVGASELVENLCTSGFNDFIESLQRAQPSSADAPRKILGAAGNIKWIFPDKSLLEQVVREFPLHVRKTVPGASVSQAVVNVTGDVTPADLGKLEQKLKAQRNRPMLASTPDWAACSRCPRTGLPAYEIHPTKNGSEMLDEALAMKVDKSSEQSPMTRLARKLLNGTTEGSHVYRMADQNLRFPYDLEEIINGRENTWLAVVHADGNGLGALIQKINADMAKNPAKTADVFARFSEALDKATAEAAHKAFDEVVAPGLDKTLKSLPLRPLILGGDDLTLIIRADLAVPFTESFLKAFQEFTANRMGEVGISGLEKGLTACAGIAFVKHSYPFHYGYELAESLCTQAKQASKSSPSAANGMIPASLALFKVQSTFSEDWKTIRERELQVKAFEGARSLHLDYGPYALNDCA